MTEDYFWGITLTNTKNTEVWDPDAKSGDADGNTFKGEHTLLVKQIVLGPEAKDGEVNVVEAEAMGYRADVKFPIAVIKGGGAQSQCVLDLLFPDPPVTFKLIKGSGPIHLLGNHSVGSGEMVGDDEEDDIEDEMDEEDLDDFEETPEKNSIEEKKRKIAAQANNSNSKPKAKKSKLDDEKSNP